MILAQDLVDSFDRYFATQVEAGELLFTWKPLTLIRQETQKTSGKTSGHAEFKSHPMQSKTLQI